jgi:predicted amidohydrolase
VLFEERDLERFRIAVVQMNARRGDIDHNLEVHRRIARAAVSEGCRVVVFPELSVTAHYGGEDVTALAEEATAGAIHKAMQALTEELGCVAGYGFCEKARGTFYNAYVLTGPMGLIGIQRKVHASQDEYYSFGMGRSLEVFDLGFCHVGVAICFDASFFEVWRVLVLKGAEVLLLPHASRTGWGEELPEDKQREDLKRALDDLPGRYGIYAEDNAVFAAYANQMDYNGHTTHLGGAYILGPDGKLLARSEPVLNDLWVSAELDPEMLYRARNSKYSLLRTRRPEMYGELTRMI